MIIRERIIAAVGARLAAIPGLAAIELLPMAQPSEFPSLSIDDLGHQIVESDATHTTYTLNLQLLGQVQGSPGPLAGADAHAKVNDLYAAVVRALLAAPDRLGEVTGEVVQTIDEGALGIDIAALAQDRMISFTLDIAIQFINRSHDPNLA
jgi:hypothetical protein